MRLASAAVALLVFGGSAYAAASVNPHELYAAGKYQAAIEAGVSQGSASSLALAAHATLAETNLRGIPCLECIGRAEAFARRAIALDPKLPDGHLYLAVALGYEARIRGVVAARLRGLVEEAKTHLDAALSADPDNARVLAALGGWNVAVAGKAGTTLAHWLYGASFNEGMKDFARAFRLAPQDIALRYQYALSLSGYDAATFQKEIEASLSRVIDGKPATAYDMESQKRARELLRLLKANDMEVFQQTVRRFQGYPNTTDSPR